MEVGEVVEQRGGGGPIEVREGGAACRTGPGVGCWAVLAGWVAEEALCGEIDGAEVEGDGGVVVVGC